MIDAPRVCTPVTPKTFDLYDFDNDPMQPYAAYFALLDGQIDGNNVYYRFELYGGIEPTLAGTFDLTSGNQANYRTCAVCVRAFEYTVDASQNVNVVKQFFQSAGTVTFATDPITSKQLSATVTGLEFQEVTVDQSTFASTPVPGGACGTVADNTIMHDQTPNAWTCSPRTDFGAGTACNCACGVYDPDCDNAAATITGCPNSFDTCNMTGECATPPPTNDTCAMATVLTVNDPATSGRTVAGSADYDGGLATCTGQAGGQPGADVVYKVTLTASTAYSIKLTNLSAAYDGSLAVLGPGAATDCDAAPITTCATGADTGAAGVDETISSFTPTTGGDFFIIVDSKTAGNAGTFDIQVTSP